MSDQARVAAPQSEIRKRGAGRAAHNYPGLSLRRNFSWTFVGNVVYAASQWASLAILARLGRPELVGKFALALAITAPIFLLGNLSLRTIQASDAREEHRFGDLLALRLITTSLALFVTFAIAATANFPRETTLVICIVAVAKGFDAIGDIFNGLFQHHERMDLVARALMANGVLSLLAMAVALIAMKSVVWGSAGYAAASLVVLIGYSIPTGLVLLKREKIETWSPLSIVGRPSNDGYAIHHSPPAMRRLLRLALPLGLAASLNSINANVPRYTVERFLGEHELGIFAALAYVVLAANLIASALAQSALPRLSRYHASGDIGSFQRLVSKLLGVAAVIGFIGCFVSAIFGSWILRILYGPEYARFDDVLLWLMIAATLACAGWFLDSSIFAAHRFLDQFRISIAVFVVVGIACGVLVPHHGLIGAAWATCVGMGFQVALKAFVVYFGLLTKTPTPVEFRPSEYHKL